MAERKVEKGSENSTQKELKKVQRMLARGARKDQRMLDRTVEKESKNA
jgi:hypothetical protein